MATEEQRATARGERGSTGAMRQGGGRIEGSAEKSTKKECWPNLTTQGVQSATI